MMFQHSNKPPPNKQRVPWRGKPTSSEEEVRMTELATPLKELSNLEEKEYE